VSDNPKDGLRMLCLACGGSLGKSEDVDEEHITDRFRTFSFGPTEHEVQLSLIAMVCPQCVDVDIVLLRRIMYNIVSQSREFTESPITMVRKDD
jgi:hypothetical protein